MTDFKNLVHDHNFSIFNDKGEKRTTYVLILTAVTMMAEIVAGSAFGSMALLADGWHMGTHVAAFLITIFAYRFARKHANNPAYTFGTGKVTVLGGFASAVALAVIALVMVLESVLRLITPHAIQFNEAIIVAALGLCVNIVSAVILKEGTNHSHNHPGHHDHHHHDYNLQSAYFHVLADALTSLLAIVALFAGKFLNWIWLDPVMGIVGAAIIMRWSFLLLKQTGPLLLDASIDKEYKSAVIEAIEADADNRVTDIHIWKVGSHHYAAIITVATCIPNTNGHYKTLLKTFKRLSHVTIEVIGCESVT